MMMILYYFYKYILAKTSIELKLKILMNSLKKCTTGLRLRQSNSKLPDTLEPSYNTYHTEDKANDKHTPVNTGPATKQDQLREPDLDDLAPSLQMTID